MPGCSGTPLESEREARSDVAAVSDRFRPGDARPALPHLDPDAPLADFLRFAVLNSPRVEAAYYEWAESVELITPARSLPDPRLTFSLDVADTIMALMPGLMMDLPGRGKLRASGDAMAEESRVAYFQFEREILRAALAVKSAYYRMHSLEESVRVQRDMLLLVRDLEQLALAQNASGRASLQDVLRAQIAGDQLVAQIAILQDSRIALAAEWKAALGLEPSAPDPAVPAVFEASAGEPDPSALLESALARNPELRGLRADVLRAAAALELARTAGVPDYSVGLMVDLEANPLLFTPAVSATLPVWRDKIAAEIEAAQRGKRAAEARLTAEEVQIAADLASMIFTVRESVRTDTLLREELLPKGKEALSAASTGYVNGRVGFLDVIDAQRTLLGFELAGVAARTQRELALAALSLAIAGTPPAGAPTLTIEE